MGVLKIALVLVVCVAFFIFEHNAPHHQPVTKDSPQKDKEDLENNGWMRE